MPQTRNSTRKNQSRLTFTPLPSSSPNLPHSRAAAIRYESMSTPRKRLYIPPSSPLNPNSVGREVSGEMTLPTPVASSQLDQNEQSVDVYSSSSDSTFQIETEGQISSKNFGRLARPLRRSSHSKPVTTNFPKQSRPEAVVPVAAGFTKIKSGTFRDDSDFSDGDDILVPSSRRKTRPAMIALSSEDESDPVLPKLGGRHRNNREPAIPMTPKTQSPYTPASSRSSALGFILGGNTGNVPLSHSQRQRLETKSSRRENDDQESRILGRTRSRGNKDFKSASPKGKTRSSTKPYKNLKNTTTESDTDEEDDEILQTPSRRSKRSARPTLSITENASDSDESSEDLVTSPKRRRLVARNVVGPSQNELGGPHNQVAEDLREDLDDLRDSEIHKRRTRGRMVNSAKSAKQEQLEILKRRRAGASTIELSSDADAVPLTSPSRDPEHSYEQMNADDHGEDDENSDMEAVRQSLRANDDEEDSFVESDEDGTLGAPDWRNEVPLEFTAHSMQKPIKSFKVAVEWMIHNKLNPAFARNDKIYQMAVYKLDDEVKGYSGSKFLSSVWNKEFLRILKEFPELSIIDVPTMFDHKCDACNRSGHPAKHQLNFTGRAYNRKTLEAISSDDDSENQSGDTSNREQSHTFYLGRRCAANAETGHALHHWRYDLNFYVMNWLKRQGYLTPEKILERAEWSTKKRERYSNEVVDGMEKSGELRTLYEEFKQNLEAARTARPDQYTYGRR